MTKCLVCVWGEVNHSATDPGTKLWQALSLLAAGSWEQSITIHILSSYSGMKCMLMIKFPESASSTQESYGRGIVLGLLLSIDWVTGADPGFVVPDAYTIWRTTLRKIFKNILGKFYKNDDFVNTLGTVQGKDL